MFYEVEKCNVNFFPHSLIALNAFQNTEGNISFRKFLPNLLAIAFPTRSFSRMVLVHDFYDSA